MYLIQAGTRPPIPLVMRVPATGARTGGLSSPDIVATRGGTSFTAGGAFVEITGDVSGLYAYTPAVGELATAGLYRYIFAEGTADGEIEVQVVGFDPTAAYAVVGSAMTLADGAITEAKITTPAQAAGRPTGALGMIRRLFEWSANKKTRDRSTGLKKVYGTDGTTVLETQTQSTTGTTDQETQGA